jgi:hypothetical protein
MPPHANPAPNQLYYGDNLAVLRDYVPSASVDLIYLDPLSTPARTTTSSSIEK